MLLVIWLLLVEAVPALACLVLPSAMGKCAMVGGMGIAKVERSDCVDNGCTKFGDRGSVG